MKALRIHEYGGPLRLDEIDEPNAGPGQVVVRIAATSLNPLDQKKASGNTRQAFPLQFPWVPGGDVSGVVQSAGNGVTAFAVGDEVFGYSAAGGAYAERIAIDAGVVAKKPRALTHEIAASIALVGQTAAQSLLAAGLQAEQQMLVHGGSGGVGTLAIQMAHRSDIRVIATAATGQAGALLALGADRVIDYQQSRFEDEMKPVDAVIDLVGGEMQQRSLRLIHPGGVLVATSQPPDAKQCEALQIRGVMVQTTVTSANLGEFGERVASGDIHAVVHRTESLWNPDAIWMQRPRGSVFGKIVFVLS